ncbi:hypothetical protein GDO86_010108 [Hymenochirus boettgeri]|nr:hypothetical protein GDO86_010108 [Hymenochirus boettgeri]
MQVTPSGFQTLLDFIYTGDLSYDSCNVDEINIAAEHLKLENVTATFRAKTQSLIRMAKSKLITQEQNEHPPLPCSKDGTEGDTNSVCLQGERKKGIKSKKAPKSKIWKKALCSYQNARNKSTNCKHSTSVKKSELITEDLADKTTGLTPYTSELNWDIFLSKDISLQTAHLSQKQAKVQQDCAMKELCISSIADITNMCIIEGSRKEVDEKYSKNKPVCTTCGKEFSEASSLRRHLRIHKGVKPYACHLCAKAFTQCNQLKTHVRTHTGEKPYQCKQCDKGFAQKCQLVFHSRMHHGEEKPYKCDVCNLQFATSSNLKIHARKHSGEKPYVCDKCGQKFAQASTLTYHVRRHTGEKPYVCDTCGKAFAVSSSLITHSRKHTGEKPYICGVCRKSYISSGELNRHFRSHSGERPFVCEICGNSYTDVKNLKKHRIKMHKGTEEIDDSKPMVSHSGSEDSTRTVPAQESEEIKNSDLFLPLTLHIGPEDHQMLLPVTDNQAVSLDTVLKASVSSYSEPQFIFLQQMY